MSRVPNLQRRDLKPKGVVPVPPLPLAGLDLSCQCPYGHPLLSFKAASIGPPHGSVLRDTTFGVHLQESGTLVANRLAQRLLSRHPADLGSAVLVRLSVVTLLAGNGSVGFGTAKLLRIVARCRGFTLTAIRSFGAVSGAVRQRGGGLMVGETGRGGGVENGSYVVRNSSPPFMTSNRDLRVMEFV